MRNESKEKEETGKEEWPLVVAAAISYIQSPMVSKTMEKKNEERTSIKGYWQQERGPFAARLKGLKAAEERRPRGSKTY